MKPIPDVQEGIKYWNTQPANLDGVLGKCVSYFDKEKNEFKPSSGGMGSGSLPRVDAVGSRLFAMHLLPELCAVPSALRPLSPTTPEDYRTRVLDVGAGIGRVTADVLLPLFSDVVLLEPVDHFIREALARGRESTQADAKNGWRGIADKSKSVTILQGTLQDFDPETPLDGSSCKLLDRVGYIPHSGTSADAASGFDVIWCQWCLGHLNDQDLVSFFRKCRKALRHPGRSLIVVKENLCRDGQDGSPRTSFDEQDSSLTRSDMAWKSAFRLSGLELIHEQIQEGFQEGLYPVKMYALR